MLSKQTHQFLSTLLRASSQVKFPNKVLYPLPKASHPLFSPQTPLSLFNYQKSFFTSSSPNDDEPHSNNQGKVEPKVEGQEEVKPKRKKRTASTKQAAKSSEPAEPLENNKSAPKKLLSVPLKPMKFPLEKGEEKLEQETYVLFNSTTPIIPYSQQTGFVTTGKLGTDQIEKKLAFFLKNEAGEIYTIGLILESNVNEELKKNISNFANDQHHDAFPSSEKNQLKANITTKHHDYKIKLTEIEFKDNCIFVKGIPYKDLKPTDDEMRIKILDILTQIKNLINHIRQSVSHEKIDVFNGLSFDMIQTKKVEPARLDELLYNILQESQKLSHYTKENLNPFIQAFLEQRSQVSRVFMIKKKLEEFKGILDLVNKSIQYADEQIWKFHEQAKARLSLDYIRSNYFSGESPAPGAKPGAGTDSKGAAQAQGTPMTGQAKKFMDKLHLLKDEVSREKIRKEIERFSLQDKMSGEYHKLYTYLDEVFSIPWENISEEFWDIEYSKKVLEERLFGLDKVKERIVEMIAVNKLKRVYEQNTEKKKGFVILLNGPPGTGKTTIAKSIAAALKRESRFISFAGVTDPAFVKGHKRTYLDAQPGIFVKELIKSKVMNPVFILDEVDKLSKHFQGVDPYYALMEILNPEENHNFTDHFLDIKVDFSQVVFILTSNQVLNMLEPLRNRLEIIEVPAYIEQEKLVIAKNYLLPKVFSEHGLPIENILLDDDTISRIIKGWCYYESGVRELRRCFEKIARKQALEILNIYRRDHPVPIEQPTIIETESQVTTPTGRAPSVSGPTSQEVSSTESNTQGIEFVKTANNGNGVNNEGQNGAIPLGTFDAEEARQLIELKNQTKLQLSGEIDVDETLKKYLGNPVFDEELERRMRKSHVGSANVLTVAGFVGHVMTVECIFDPSSDKKGMLTSSGNLQKVLQESLTIGRLVAFRFLTEEKIKELSDKNVHIHFLQGGVPKDGPSAGVSICSALLSLMMGKPIPQDISMTGELSLNGDVCKIGGVQAKVTASKTLGLNRIILPWGNKNEFFELPQLLKEGLTVYFVKEYKEVFNILFEESATATESTEKYVGRKFTGTIGQTSHIPSNAYLSEKNE